MTKADRDALRALLAKTTKEPWRHVDNVILSPDDDNCPRGHNPENYVALDVTEDDDTFIVTTRGKLGVLLDALDAADKMSELLSTASKYLTTANQIIADDMSSDEDDFSDASELIGDCERAIAAYAAVAGR